MMSLLPDIKVDFTPLVESVPNGVEKIFNLFFGTKITKQEAARLLIKAQAERNAERIKNGELAINENNQLIDFNKIQSNNIHDCIEYAVQDAMNQSQIPPDENISQTFFNKWREYAKNIDESDMKHLWAKLLTKEIYEPNTVNLRVLNALSVISSKEIEVFVETLPYIVYSSYIIADFIPENKKKYLFDMLYNMGIIAEIPKSGFKITNKIAKYNDNDNEYSYFYIHQRDKLIAFHDNKCLREDGLAFQFIELTVLGKELYSITDPIEDEYLILLNNVNKETVGDSYITKVSIYQIENNEVTKTLLEKVL